MADSIDAYFDLAELCISNAVLDNNIAQARAKGMFEALDIWSAADSTLPKPMIEGFRSLRGSEGEHPKRSLPSLATPHRLWRLLGFDSVQKFRCHLVDGTQAASSVGSGE